jgi:hypothetical protein
MKFTQAIIVLSAGSILSLGIFFTACKKDSNSGSSSTNEADAANMSASAATADNEYNDVLNVGLQVGAGETTTIASYVSGSRKGSHTELDGPGGSPCAIFSGSISDTTTYPKTVSIDFGTGCTGADGITRKGMVTYVYSGSIIFPGTTVSVTFTGYSVNGYQLAGTYSITNNSTANGLSFMTSVVGGQVIFPDASSYSYAGSKTVLQTGGIGSLNYADYIFSITGKHTFSSSAGKSLIDSTTTPLVWETSCEHIVSGVIGFTYSFSGVSLNGTLDYGNGTCDSLATIKVGATTKIVVLP